ncbi:MAG TPA: prepilin-type N-terminal cleavage/methylation domain-containing protein [Candidatus Sumerlaeota bacterium]|mgnify:CR=1 FL=1|nr:prepilin-type N-terminal cleavage/methylation domain-containing protein [Candidatus Sumerlaeota bacterium]HPS03323.1 prepilin-type N-terminal cleavage/methylation domain-containing protein [Candidatus Sumerlaeota bacterium]
MNRVPRSPQAFTLIELLIVVAIIAILAAIAVPNFLEAQVRAKISRVRSDMRSVATGLESYITDNSTYPNDSDAQLDDLAAAHKQHGLKLLTTPISYIASVPKDPFLTNKAGGGYMQLASGADHQGWDGPYGSYSAQGSEPKVQCYLLFSCGPNPTTEEATVDNDLFPWGTQCHCYDATNGTKSTGDIYRPGGGYKQGRYTVDGVQNGNFPN